MSKKCYKYKHLETRMMLLPKYKCGKCPPYPHNQSNHIISNYVENPLINTNIVPIRQHFHEGCSTYNI